MLIAAWNVNSLAVRLPRLIAWLAATRPDAVVLQETKVEDAKFFALAERCAASRIDRNARKGRKPSDHAPVMVELRD